MIGCRPLFNGLFAVLFGNLSYFKPKSARAALLWLLGCSVVHVFSNVAYLIATLFAQPLSDGSISSSEDWSSPAWPMFFLTLALSAEGAVLGVSQVLTTVLNSLAVPPAVLGSLQGVQQLDALTGSSL